MLEVRHRRVLAWSLYLALSGVSGWEAPESQYLCEFCVEGQGRPASEEAARWVKFLQDAREQMGLGLVGERGSTGVDGGSHRRKLYHVGSAEGTFMMDALMWKVDKEMQNAQNILWQSLMGEDLSMPTLPADDDGRSNSESFAKKLYEKYKSKPRSKDVKVDATALEDVSGTAGAADASAPSGDSVQAADKSVASTRGGSAGAAGATSSNGVKEGGTQSSGRASTPEPDGSSRTREPVPASPSEPPQTSQQQLRQQQQQHQEQQQQTSSVSIATSTTSSSTAEPSSATTSQQSAARASQTGSLPSAPADGKSTTSPSHATGGSGSAAAIPSSGMRVQDGRGGQYAATQDRYDLLFPRQGQQDGLLHGTGLRGAGR